MSDGPSRIVLITRPGFDLQQWSRLHNGHDAVKVCGTTNFRNPYDGTGSPAQRTALYRDLLARPQDSRRAQWVLENLYRLRGKNLACTCPREWACHGDVLLELANAPGVVAKAGGESEAA